jgi:hypothetical protein
LEHQEFGNEFFKYRQEMLETDRISKYSVTTSRGRIADYASRRFLSASSKMVLMDYSLFVLKNGLVLTEIGG